MSKHSGACKRKVLSIEEKLETNVWKKWKCDFEYILSNRHKGIYIVTKIKVRGWTTFKCCQVSKNKYKEIEEKGKLLSIWIKDQRVKKSRTTFYAWIFIYKGNVYKWKSLYPAEVAPFSDSSGCFSGFDKLISHQLLHKAMHTVGKTAK